MKTEYKDFEVLIPTPDGESIAEEITVSVPMIWDEEAQDFLLTPEAHEIIENTKIRYMGLLNPEQLRELRNRLGNLSQKAIGELLQVGEKSWSRWESGKQRPSRSVNLLLRALYDGEISVEYLAHISGVRPTWEKIVHCPQFFRTVEKRPILMDSQSRSEKGVEETLRGQKVVLAA
jgi:DNA-binding transcriptional regulator YiaG